MFLELGQGKYKLSLQHHVVPESKEVVRKVIGSCQKGIRANLKEFPIAKAGTF